MNKSALLVTVFLISPLANSATRLTASGGQVGFEAIGKPSMLKIKGTGSGAASQLVLNGGKLSGEVTFMLDSLKTGIDMRDEHMKEKYLQVKANPVARLTLTELALPTGWSLQNPLVNSANFRGKLMLHGVSHDIEGTYSIDSAQLGATAQFEIKLSDYNIDIPNYLGVKVADTVKVSTSFNHMTLIQK